MAHYKVTRTFSSKNSYMVEADDSDAAIKKVILNSTDSVITKMNTDMNFVEWDADCLIDHPKSSKS